MSLAAWATRRDQLNKEVKLEYEERDRISRQIAVLSTESQVLRDTSKTVCALACHHPSADLEGDQAKSMSNRAHTILEEFSELAVKLAATNERVYVIEKELLEQ